jgi:hypothetical protein
MADGRIDSVRQDKKTQENGFVNRAIDEVLGTVSSSDDGIKAKTDSLLESAAKNSAAARYAMVTADGLLQTIPGIGHGIMHNFSHPGEFGMKALTAFTIGLGMRYALPERGAAKALVGTVMMGSFLWDGLKPVMQAYRDAGNAKDLDGVHNAARKMGDGLGLFAVDAYVGAKVGGAGERRMERYLKWSKGEAGYLSFEKAKADFWNSDKHFWGRGLNRVATTLDSAFGKAAERLMPKETGKPQLTPEETRAAIVKAIGQTRINQERSVFWRTGAKEPTLSEMAEPIGDGGFYRQGAKDASGKRVGYSETINEQLGDKVHEADGLPASTEHASNTSLDLSGKVRKALGESIPEPLDVKAPGDGTSGKAPKRPAIQVSPENDPAVFDRLAKHAKKEQENWSDEDIAIADLRDGVKGPIVSVSDATRNGRLYGPEYDLPNSQLQGIADQMKTKQDVEEAGQLLGLHAGAALQAEQRNPLTAAMNTLAADFNGVLLEGCRRAGIKDAWLEGKTVSKTIVTGRDNYTIPHIEGVVDGAVTAYPRSQTELRGVFGPINAHENYGHDNVFPTLARFPKDIRDKIISRAVEQGLADAGLPLDHMTDMPGAQGGKVKTVDLLKAILFAQANENTSDIGGTAVTVLGTPDSLNVLLKSLRADGKLETRSVYGSQFPEIFEAHGIDRFRLLLCAEVIKQRAQGDKELLQLSKELVQLADAVSRPGENYVWANTDQKGKFFTISRKVLDGIIPHLVKAQLETPLEGLKGHALQEILPNMPETWKKISFLADQMVDSALKGKDDLGAPFNKQDYRPFEVSTAGLIAWKRAIAKGGDEAASLGHINKMFDKMFAQYESGNPHVVPVTRSPIDTLRTQPLSVAGRLGATGLRMQQTARENSALYASPLGSMAGSVALEQLFAKYKKEHNLQ